MALPVNNADSVSMGFFINYVNALSREIGIM